MTALDTSGKTIQGWNPEEKDHWDSKVAWRTLWVSTFVLIIGFEQRRHLVDKRTGTAGARTIHALFDAVVKVDNLCILTAKLNGYIGLGDKSLNRAL